VTRWTFADGVAHLVLDRPPCNEIGLAMLDDLERFVAEVADRTEEVAAVVISSDQRGGFSAGADLRGLYEGLCREPKERHAALLAEFIDRVHAVMDALDMLPQTTIAVVAGICFGGGFELALTCDLIIAERTARFCFPELRLGLIPGFGGIPRLERDVGNALVRDLLLTGRSINARRALEAGLVREVVPKGAGLDAAMAAARQVTKFDAETRARAKLFAKRLPAARLAEEKALFLELADRDVLLHALERFVQSDDIRPYLP